MKKPKYTYVETIDKNNHIVYVRTKIKDSNHKGNILDKIKSIFKKFKKKDSSNQSTFCYCPQCNNELISSGSFVSDEKVVAYKCTNCGCISEWNFDCAPTPILVHYTSELHFDNPKDLF